MSEVATKYQISPGYEGALDLCWYPETKVDAPIGMMTSHWTGKPTRYGHCGEGPSKPNYHYSADHCPVAIWNKHKQRWDLCACECHEDVRNDEDALREIIVQCHTKATRDRERIMARKASTTTSKKASTTKERIGRRKPEANAATEVVNKKAPSRKPADCQCNCGGQTKGGRFLPGHDAKLKSALQSAYREAKTEAQRRKIEDQFTALKWGKYIPSV